MKIVLPVDCPAGIKSLCVLFLTVQIGFITSIIESFTYANTPDDVGSMQSKIFTLIGHQCMRLVSEWRLFQFNK